MGAMAVTLAQTLGQNLGMMWNKHRSSAGTNLEVYSHVRHTQHLLKCRGAGGGGVHSSTLSHVYPNYLIGDCKCPDIWLGCIMEDTG